MIFVLSSGATAVLATAPANAPDIRELRTFFCSWTPCNKTLFSVTQLILNRICNIYLHLRTWMSQTQVRAPTLSCNLTPMSKQTLWYSNAIRHSLHCAPRNAPHCCIALNWFVMLFARTSPSLPALYENVLISIPTCQWR